MDTADIALMIPIVAIIMGIAFAMLALWLNYRRKRELFQLYHAQRMAAIEKGVELPPLPGEIFEGLRPPSLTARTRAAAEPSILGHLRRGLTLLFVGIIIFVALIFTAGLDVAWWGLIPSAIGVADLLFYFVTAHKLNAGATQQGNQPEGPQPPDDRR